MYGYIKTTQLGQPAYCILDIQSGRISLGNVMQCEESYARTQSLWYSEKYDMGWCGKVSHEYCRAIDSSFNLPDPDSTIEHPERFDQL